LTRRIITMIWYALSQTNHIFPCRDRSRLS
jgi:hypothetical protein